MAKPKSTAKLVVTSIVVSLVVIAVCVLLFLHYLVPAYQISEKDVFDVLVKLFPLLIGLTLIQIGIAVGKRNDEDYASQIDKLPPNAYSKAYENIKDDPAHVSTVGPETQPINENALQKEPIPEPVAASTSEPQAEEKPAMQAPPQVIIREVPVEVIKEVIKEVPIEVIKEVPVKAEEKPEQEEATAETQAEEPKKEAPTEEEATAEESTPEENAEEAEPEEAPAEEAEEETSEGEESEAEEEQEEAEEAPEEETEEEPEEEEAETAEETAPAKGANEADENEAKEEEHAPEGALPLMLGLEEFLSEEIKSAKEIGYDLTLCRIKNGDGATEGNIEKDFSAYATVFDKDDGTYLVFPFANESETKRLLEGKGYEYSLSNLSGESDANSMMSSLS